MLLIKKGSVPGKLIEAKTEGCIRYDNLPPGVKQVMRTSLYKEQHGLCAYCMAKVTETKESPIEHIIPRSTTHTGDVLSLDWKNMVLSCDGGRTNNAKPVSCDAYKGDKPLLNLSPLHDACIKRISYSHSGKILSEDDQYKHDLEDVLNLNNEMLVYTRKQILNRLNLEKNKKPRDRQARIRHLSRQLENLQRPDGEGNLEAFVGVSIWYVKNKYEKLRR
ncbi:MAG: retron system putative HNH endonuclease [Sphaerochaeta sp.]